MRKAIILIIAITMMQLLSCESKDESNEKAQIISKQQNNKNMQDKIFYFTHNKEIYSFNIKSNEVLPITNTDNKVFDFLQHDNYIVYSTINEVQDNILINSLFLLNILSGETVTLISNSKQKMNKYCIEQSYQSCSIYPLYLDLKNNDIYFFNNGISIVNIDNMNIIDKYKRDIPSWFIKRIKVSDKYIVIEDGYYESSSVTVLKRIKNQLKEIDIYDIYKTDASRFQVNIIDLVDDELVILYKYLKDDKMYQYIIIIDLNEHKIKNKIEFNIKNTVTLHFTREIIPFFIFQEYEKKAILVKYENNKIIDIIDISKYLANLQIGSLHYNNDGYLFGRVYKYEDKVRNKYFVFNVSEEEYYISDNKEVNKIGFVQ